MKAKSNKNQIKESELKSRPDQCTTAPAKHADPNPEPTRKDTTNQKPLPYVDYQQRELNRALPTSEVLTLLRQHLPDQYRLAEVVGKWIWIEFPEAPAQDIRAKLSQFGFHWNNVRKCWQHPCGHVTQRGQVQPREKYHSYFPSDNHYEYTGPARTAEQVAA